MIPTFAVQLGKSPVPAGVRESYLHKYSRAMSNVWVAAQWLTPAQAAQWLKDHKGPNRPLSPTWRDLRRKIDQGLWEINGETVVFSSEGFLLNGQHRLTAIASGEEPVCVLVVYGVDPAAFSTYDQNKKRNRADILAIVGYENVTLLASALGWVERYYARHMEYTGFKPLSNEQVPISIEHYPELAESVKVAVGDWKRCSLQIPPSVLAATHYILNREDSAGAKAFFDQVVKELRLEEGSWEYLLRDRLKSMDRSTKRHDSVHKMALVLKAWKNVVSGQPVGKQLQWRSTEPFPYLWEPNQETI